jgi:hypothetical protein
MGRQHVHDQPFKNRPPRLAALRRRTAVLTRIFSRFGELRVSHCCRPRLIALGSQPYPFAFSPHQRIEAQM